MTKERRRIENQYARLIMRDGTLCHYCEKPMGPKSGRGRASMSREHVVPQSFGGPNRLDNMVLACRNCNNSRGNELDYCHCSFCTKATNKYWWDHMFLILCIMEKPRVFKSHGKWFVSIGGKVHVHKSFVEAHKTLWLRRESTEDEVNYS